MKRAAVIGSTAVFVGVGSYFITKGFSYNAVKGPSLDSPAAFFPGLEGTALGGLIVRLLWPKGSATAAKHATILRARADGLLKISETMERKANRVVADEFYGLRDAVIHLGKKRDALVSKNRSEERIEKIEARIEKKRVVARRLDKLLRNNGVMILTDVLPDSGP